MKTPVLTVSGLVALRAAGPVTLLDVRWRLGATDGRERYEAGHLPGASYVDMDTALADHTVVDDPDRGGRHPLPDPDLFGAAMRALGVRRAVPVVCYDEVGGTSAARAWWLLRHYGHEHVYVLDGGVAAWELEVGEIETGPGAEPEPGDFDGSPGHMPVRDADTVRRAERILDARSAERYRGEVEPVDPVAGHVPGALNAPASENLTDTGYLRPFEVLLRQYADLGTLGDEPDVVVYCGSGITAAHDVLVLEHLGIPAALYPGSWSHWVMDPERPVETGWGPPLPGP